MSGGDPDGAKKAQETTFAVGAVVGAHDGLDGLGGFFTVVEWHLGEVVVHDVRLDDAVHEISPDETEITVDRGGGTASEGPRTGLVVRERRIGVLKVRYPYWILVSDARKS